MRILSIIYILVLILFLVVPATDLFALDYPYPLLGGLATKSDHVVVGKDFSTKNKKAFVVIVKFAVVERLKGKGEVAGCVCQKMIGEECGFSDTPPRFLFLKEVNPNFPFLRAVRLDGPIYMCSSTDGGSLEYPRDVEVVKKFIKGLLNKKDAIVAAIPAESEPFVEASLLESLLKVAPSDPSVGSLLAKILRAKTKVEIDKIVALQMVEDYRDKVNAGELFDVVANHFKSGHGMPKELEVLSRLPVGSAKKSALFLGQVSSKAYGMDAIHYLGDLGDRDAILKVVSMYRKGEVGTLSMASLHELTRALFLVRECQPIKEMVDKAMPLYRWFENKVRIPSDPPTSETISNYYRCLAHEISDESAKEMFDFFNSSPARENRRVIGNVLNALSIRISKGTFPRKSLPLLKPIVIDMAEKGHPLVVARAIRFIERHFPEVATCDFMKKIALKPDAKKYHVSSAILALWKKGDRACADQIANASRFDLFKAGAKNPKN